MEDSMKNKLCCCVRCTEDTSGGRNAGSVQIAGCLLAFFLGSTAVATVVFFCPGARAAQAPPDSGLQRATLNLSDYRGQVIVLHFWATWCRPCIREMPSLVRFYNGPYQQLEKRGLLLLTVSNDVRLKDLTGYLAVHPAPFPVFYDSLGTVNERLKLRGVPHTVVIGRDGKVMVRLLGEQNWQSHELLTQMQHYVTHQVDDHRRAGTHQ